MDFQVMGIALQNIGQDRGVSLGYAEYLGYAIEQRGES